MNSLIYRAFVDELGQIKLAGMGQVAPLSQQTVQKLMKSFKRPAPGPTIKTPPWVAKMGPLKKVSGIPTKLLLNPKFQPYFDRVAKGGKSAPRLFPGGPLVSAGMLSKAAPAKMAPQATPASFQMKSLL
jgi:hypothetical protein